MFECVRSIHSHSDHKETSLTHNTQVPGNIQALSSVELQGVLDACLFEPGVWQESKVRKMPSCIPCKNRRENLSTPSGLLFNELVKSPRTILSCLEEMLNLIMEMDSGRYTQVLFCDSLRTSSRDSCRGIYDVCDSK